MQKQEMLSHIRAYCVADSQNNVAKAQIEYKWLLDACLALNVDFKRTVRDGAKILLSTSCGVLDSQAFASVAAWNVEE